MPLNGRGDRWPWSYLDQTRQAPTEHPSNLPSVSIVVPSYNCGEYIEETLRSILLQNYPVLQLIVVDGASSDGTLAILDYYKHWINIIISEPDCGQANAINKGLALCVGEYFNWINADDVLAPGALLSLFRNCSNSPDIIASTVGNFVEDDPLIVEKIQNFGFSSGVSSRNFIRGPLQWRRTKDISYHQPGVWIKASLLRDIGGLSDDMRYIFDVEMMIRLLAAPRTVFYSDIVSIFFRLREGSKTVSEHDSFMREAYFVPMRIFDNFNLVALHQFQSRLLLNHGWNLYVGSLFKKSPSFVYLFELFGHCLSDPFHRINRFSIGAAKYHFVGMLDLLGRFRIFAFLRK
jgi:glycosyltransferase involved in cell wall biosynthesis